MTDCACHPADLKIGQPSATCPVHGVYGVETLAVAARDDDFDLEALREEHLRVAQHWREYVGSVDRWLIADAMDGAKDAMRDARQTAAISRGAALLGWSWTLALVVMLVCGLWALAGLLAFLALAAFGFSSVMRDFSESFGRSADTWRAEATRVRGEMEQR